ncbi:dihydroxyacetone kinase [Striga asiatica]|uniref:Dihydroxyacetone kinase n=1 Tax=Striga asiatica TaxID=4170 RepID=A0A5A7R3B8_STRAF|nr:dihydroxyacetone kinase [Striga asiatica]
MEETPCTSPTLKQPTRFALTKGIGVQASFLLSIVPNGEINHCKGNKEARANYAIYHLPQPILHEAVEGNSDEIACLKKEVKSNEPRLPVSGRGINKWKEVEGKSTIVKEHQLNGESFVVETKYVHITRGSRVVHLINKLGATTLMELMIAAGKTIPRLQLEHGLAVERVFSISVMKADETVLKRLDAPTKAPNWPVAADGDRPPAKIPIPIPPCRLKKNDEVS